MARLLDSLQRVEACMTRVTSTPDNRKTLVVRAVAYHLRAGGSRIRAQICLHASQQLDIHDDTAVLIATACELIHNASLVQDDVFDEEAVRRGVESVWKLFGDTIAICSGDLMLSGAFAILAELPSANLVSSAIQLVFRHTQSVIVGQGIEKEAVPETLADYEVLAINKSASLLTLPLHLPLLVSGHHSFMALAQRTVEAFAVAYQIADDLADYPQDQRAGALNVLSVLCRGYAMTLDQARAAAAERSGELLRQCIVDAAGLPKNCAAILVSHASTMLTEMEAGPENKLARARSMSYVG